jgi:hypothetical protein
MSKLKGFVENPWINLISGLILLITSGNEILKTLGDGDIGAHHGVAFFGLVQIIQCLPHILHGTEQVSKISRD